MAAVIVPAPKSPRVAANSPGPQQNTMHVAIHVQADVLAPDLARRAANRWLFQNAGNLLDATNPELIVNDRLLWRLDVDLTYPDLKRPGYGIRRRIGQFLLDAITGEPLISPTYIEELRATADALTAN